MPPRLARAVGVACITLIAASQTASAQRSMIFWGEAGGAAHRVSLGREVEQSSGTLIGAGVETQLGPWLSMRARGRAGDLVAEWAPSEDRSLSELSVEGVVKPLPWLGLSAEAVARGYRTSLGSQQWTMLVIGPRAMIPLYDQRVHASVRLAVIPHARVSATPSPTRALAGDVEVRYSGPRIQGAVSYTLERFDFAVVNGEQRLEQLGGFALRLGWRTGWLRWP